MQLQTFRERIQTRLEDSSGTFWSSDEIDSYINTAIAYYWDWLLLARHTACLTSVNRDIVSGTDTIALPADFYDIRLVEYVKNGIYKPIEEYERHSENNYTSNASSDIYNSIARYTYRRQGANLILEPIPNENLTNGIKITYFKSYPAELSDDTDEPESGLYNNLIIEKSIEMAKAKEETLGGSEDPNTALLLQLENIFKQKIGLIKAATRQSAEPYYLDGLF